MFNQILDPSTLVFMIPITAIVLGHFRRMAVIKQKKDSEIQRQVDLKFDQINQEIKELRDRLNEMIVRTDQPDRHH